MVIVSQPFYVRWTLSVKLSGQRKWSGLLKEIRFVYLKKKKKKKEYDMFVWHITCVKQFLHSFTDFHQGLDTNWFQCVLFDLLVTLILLRVVVMISLIWLYFCYDIMACMYVYIRIYKYIELQCSSIFAKSMNEIALYATYNDNTMWFYEF